MKLIDRYHQAVAKGTLTKDAAQEGAALRLEALAVALTCYRHRRWTWWRSAPAPHGLYLWGGVGRGKSMLMDLFFTAAPIKPKRRVHFNAFINEVHARIHAMQECADDPIIPVAREIAARARLLCFDEFQVNDVTDAMILGRLCEQLFALDVVIVATSNTPPDRLYEGGINRQLFLPFIAEIKRNLDVIELNAGVDYRIGQLMGVKAYITPLGPEADSMMDAVWLQLTDTSHGEALVLKVLGRDLRVPEVARGVARFSFEDLCVEPLATADYLAIAQTFHTVLIDRIPALAPERRNEARRFTLLLDTLYDEEVKLVCSAAALPDSLYPEGDGADAFRRTASRLAEMQNENYLKRKGR